MKKPFKEISAIRKNFFLIPVIFLIGCSTMAGNSLKNDVALTLSSGYLYFVNIYKNDTSLFVSGKINKSLGKDLSRTKIVATFMDEGGKVITQVKESVIPNRTHLHRGNEGRFSIKIPYDPAIKSCELDVEWK